MPLRTFMEAFHLDSHLHERNCNSKLFSSTVVLDLPNAAPL